MTTYYKKYMKYKTKYLKLKAGQTGGADMVDGMNSSLYEAWVWVWGVCLRAWYPHAVQYLRELMNREENSITIELPENEIPEGVITVLAYYIAHNIYSLTYLKFSNNSLLDNAAQNIAESLHTNISLLTLDLSNNKIGDEGVKAIAESLKKNKTLKTLNLAHNQIGDVGTIEIAKSLEKNTTLEELDLSHNQDIGNDGLLALGRTIHRNILKNREDIRKRNLRLNKDNPFKVPKALAQMIKGNPTQVHFNWVAPED